MWFYALNFSNLPHTLSSRDLVRAPRPERSPSQPLLTHGAGRLSRKLPAPGIMCAAGSLRSAPDPSMALSLLPPPRVFPHGHDLLHKLLPHPLTRQAIRRPQLSLNPRGRARGPPIPPRPFNPGIAPSSQPRGPTTPKALSAQPSTAPLLPAPRSGVLRSHDSLKLHLPTKTRLRLQLVSGSRPRSPSSRLLLCPAHTWP